MYSLRKKNFIFLAISFAVIVLGFVLMIGGGSEDGVSFNPEIFSVQRTTVAPVICLIGFLMVIGAIMWQPKSERNDGLVIKEEEDKSLTKK